MTAPFAFLPNIGVPELLIVLGILILIFGPKQIPKAAKSLGKGLRGFRDSVEGKDDEDDAAIPEKVDATAGDAEAPADAPAPDAVTAKDETRA